MIVPKDVRGSIPKWGEICSQLHKMIKQIKEDADLKLNKIKRKQWAWENVKKMSLIHIKPRSIRCQGLISQGANS